MKFVFFPLPKELSNSIRGFFNTQDNDSECFRWRLVRHVNAVKKEPEKKSDMMVEIF